MKYTFNKSLPLREKYMEVSYMVQDCLKTLMDEYDIGIESIAGKMDTFVNYIPYLTEDQLKSFISEDEINAWYNSLEDEITFIDKNTILENFLELIEVQGNKIYINEEGTKTSFLSTVGSLPSVIGASIVASNLINTVISNFNICRDNCVRRFAYESNEKIKEYQEKSCILDCEAVNYQQAINILESKKREVCDKESDPIHCITNIDNKIQQIREKIAINRNDKREIDQKLFELQQTQQSQEGTTNEEK